MKLIDKDALVAEIGRRQKIHFNDYHIIGNNSPADYGACNALTQILAFIDTLEVKEVDLDEVSRHYALNNTPWDDCVDEIQDAYKAGFELGLKAQKGE